MAITNELREYIAEQQWCAKGMLSAIADRIDAEHERDLRESYDKRKYLRHYHEPTTVEGVLREFAERYLDYEGVPSAGRRGVSEALMDEYAARLRLAEESAVFNL